MKSRATGQVRVQVQELAVAVQERECLLALNVRLYDNVVARLRPVLVQVDPELDPDPAPRPILRRGAPG